MTGKDEYYNRAKQQGYRARSAFKLAQLDGAVNLLDDGDTVVDLGAAPGGWMQVAAERVGNSGTVIGVDRQSIDELEDVNATVEYIRGDITEERTKDRIRDVVAGDDDNPVDVVISDMAPNMTGEYDLDHARSVHLARQASEVADDILTSGGDLVVKVFDGRDLDDLESSIESAFEYVRQMRPDACRDESSELYLVARNRLTAPVRSGDEIDVEIVDTGSEGDGIAQVDGFTIFVSDASEGEQIHVEVTDVKPNFAFAEPIDES
ncbi:23S rRNA (uridine(2552)-2'-O)-methyltransferase [Halovenus rubra]|uniref:Ribosomal RNA large subunit methyltransferase E n=2 Tax=Halovenus rubra TaxID=869890 RepID=A0ABD5XD01_9EURY|nr:23S rRNA (uridine(2552)-2'-O)-methyltransferase [Halovenus rubra]